MNSLMLRGEVGIDDGGVDKYQYLLHNTLTCNFNPVRFRERVKEVYFEQLDATNGDAPSLFTIVEYIDEENVVTISEFFKSFGYDEEYIDNMVARYAHDVSCTMDDYVADILKGYGMSHLGDPYMVMFNKQYQENDAQNVLLRRFL